MKTVWIWLNIFVMLIVAFTIGLKYADRAVSRLAWSQVILLSVLLVFSLGSLAVKLHGYLKPPQE